MGQFYSIKNIIMMIISVINHLFFNSFFWNWLVLPTTFDPKEFCCVNPEIDEILGSRRTFLTNLYVFFCFSKHIFAHFLYKKWKSKKKNKKFIVRKSGQSYRFRFRTLFHQEKPIIKNVVETNSNHFENISNWFLVPKLVYSEKIRSIASISVSDSFLSRGTDHQECKRIISRIVLTQFQIDFSTQN